MTEPKPKDEKKATDSPEETSKKGLDEAWASSWRQGALGLGMVGVSVALVVATRSYVLQVVSVAAGLFGAKLFGEWLRPRTLTALPRKLPWVPEGTTYAEALREVWGPAVILGLTLVVYWPLVQGYMPWMADHTVHQLKAYVLAEHLLPSGRIMGWTPFSGAGYPAEQLYPILGDLWVAFVRYATFKSLSWETTYAWAFLGVLLFIHLVPYYLGRRLYGSVAGVVFALLVFTDTGGFREGGFVFTVRYGVWPLMVGVGFSLLAIERLVTLRKQQGLEGLASYALMVGLALLAHPISLVFLFLAVPAYALYEHLWYRRPVLWLKGLGGMVLGVGIAAFWFVPYFLRAPDFSSHVSNLWKSLPQIGQGVVGGHLYDGSWSWAFVLGVLGVVMWVVDRRPLGRFFGALAALLLTVSSLTVYGGTDVENWLGSIRHMQFQRFVIYIKMFLFLAAGALVQRVFFGLRAGGDGEAVEPLVRGGDEKKHDAQVPEDRPLWKRLRLGVGLLVLAPLTTPVLVGVWTQRLAPLTRLQTRKSGVGFYDDLKRLTHEIRRRESREGGADGFYRVAYWTGFNDHSLANGPVLGGHAHVKCSFIPSETFKYLTHVAPSKVPDTPKDFQVLNVKYIIANKPLPAALRRCPVLARSGGLTLYEFPDYTPSQATLLGGGGGRVEVKSFDDEEIRLKVGGLDGEADLVLHTAHFADWSAHQGGRRLKIRPHDSLAPHVPGLMKVRVRNGEVVFEYSQGALGWLTKLTTLLSLLLCVGFVLVRREVGWAAKGWGWCVGFSERWRRPLLWVGYATLLSVPLLFAFKWATAPELPREGRSLTWDLADARVYIRRRDGGRTRCRLFLDGRFLCGSKAYQFVGPVAEEWGLRNRRGLWAHPHAEGTLVIEYPQRELGASLELEWGLLGSSSGGRGQVTLAVFLGDEPLARVTRRRAGWSGPRSFSTSKWAGKKETVRFEVSADQIGGRHFVFDATLKPGAR